MNSKRVCVTLPEELYWYFEERSKLTGLSISKIISQRLSTGKPILIADDGILAAFQEVRDLLLKVKASGKVDADVVEVFRRQCDFWERLLDLQHTFKTVSARKSSKGKKQKEPLSQNENGTTTLQGGAPKTPESRAYEAGQMMVDMIRGGVPNSQVVDTRETERVTIKIVPASKEEDQPPYRKLWNNNMKQDGTSESMEPSKAVNGQELEKPRKTFISTPFAKDLKIKKP